MSIQFALNSYHTMKKKNQWSKIGNSSRRSTKKKDIWAKKFISRLCNLTPSAWSIGLTSLLPEQNKNPLSHTNGTYTSYAYTAAQKDNRDGKRGEICDTSNFNHASLAISLNPIYVLSTEWVCVFLNLFMVYT